MEDDQMPIFQQLRWLYHIVYFGGFFMLGSALLSCLMVPVASPFSNVSQAFSMAGMLIVCGGRALRLIVRNIEALETELAKFVESEDPASASRAFANFLRGARDL